MLEKTGIPTNAQLEAIKPSAERLAKGPVVLVECFQEIPCDPCHPACKREAILPFVKINDLPRLNYDRCNGCGNCIGACPGLAIFVVDQTWSEKEAMLMIPWEFLPVPEEGSSVKGLNRKGETVGSVKVLKVKPVAKGSETYVLTLAVPKEETFNIRSIRVR